MSSTSQYYDEEIKAEEKRAQKQYNKISAQTAAINNQYANDMNAVVDTGVQNSVNKLQGEIDKIPTAYQSIYDMNAIQQKINERQVAENMANLGQTNSGLSRTQQTALAIQRSNSDAATRQQHNAATLSLKQQIADVVAQGETQKAQNLANANYETAKANANTYNQLLSAADSRAYSTALQRMNNAAAIEQARIEAENKFGKQITTEYENNAIWVYQNGGEKALNEYLNKIQAKEGFSDAQLIALGRFIQQNYLPQTDQNKINNFRISTDAPTYGEMQKYLAEQQKG